MATSTWMRRAGVAAVVVMFGAAGGRMPGAAGQADGSPLQETPPWSDEGDTGPEHWHELSPAFLACGVGLLQSPIDLRGPVPRDLPNIVVHYQPTRLNIANNGHTIQVTYDTGSYIELDGGRYDLLQFHFHAPSEHRVNGARAAAELHLVHRNAAGALAVVGVLLEPGETNAAFDAVMGHLPEREGPVREIAAQVDATAMLPRTQATFRYDGSLTTPPCSEGVKWNVMVDPVTIGKEQLAAFTRLFDHNARPVQAMGARTLAVDSSP